MSAPKLLLKKKAPGPVGSLERDRGYRVVMIKSATFERWRDVCRKTGLTNDDLAAKLLALVEVR